MADTRHDSDLSILLLGATGQLGSQLVPTLAPLGQLVATVRPGAEPPRHGALAGVELVDLADAERLRELVRTLRPQLIVNAAAYTAVDAAESHQDLAMTVNATAPAILAEEAVKLGASLIHYSTDYVFDGSGQRPWCEADAPGPINFYGLTKLAGEELIRATGARHLIMRTSWVYGVMGQNFIKKMLHLASRPELSIVDDQIGAPTSARFLAEVTGAVVGRLRDERHYFVTHGGTLHAACTGETSWYGVAREIFRLTGVLLLPSPIPNLRPVPSTSYPTPARRPMNSRLNLCRLRREFGIEPPAWQAELSANLVKIFDQLTHETRPEA